jgi:hypothetical protein
MEVIRCYEECLRSQNWANLKDALCRLAAHFHERTEDKVVGDVYFMGHSLGGGLAQLYTWYYTAHRKRVPLPGCVCHCISFNGPAIDRRQSEKFISFGRNNRELFAALQIRFHVKHQLEYGDFVPEGGEVHLGARLDELNESSWLDFEANLFKPMPTAQALTILTLDTHGRRIGGAELGLDYTSNSLSYKKLYEFDSSWCLGKDLEEQMGYRILISPKIFEVFRRAIGSVLYYPMLLIRPFVDHIPPGGDENGVISVQYAHNFWEQRKLDTVPLGDM